MDRTNIEIGKRRIELLSARATLSNDPESWRILRNVAAAYGDKEVAACAQNKMSAPSAASVTLQVSSLTPLARTAWLSRWATEQGVSIEKNGDVFTLAGRAAQLQKLNGHPEIIFL